MTPTPPPASTRTPWAVLGFALGFPCAYTWLYFAVAEGAAAQLLYGAGKTVQFALPAVWAVAVERARPRPAAPRVRDLGTGLLTGAIIGGALVLLHLGVLSGHPLMADVPGAIRAKLAGFGIDTAARFTALGVLYALVHSGLEEYYWRGFVFDRLSRRLGPWRAIVLSSLGFAAHHAVIVGELLGGSGAPTWIATTAVAAAGAFWAWLYHRSRSLYAPWLSHLVVDAVLMGLGLALWSWG